MRSPRKQPTHRSVPTLMAVVPTPNSGERGSIATSVSVKVLGVYLRDVRHPFFTSPMSTFPLACPAVIFSANFASVGSKKLETARPSCGSAATTLGKLPAGNTAQPTQVRADTRIRGCHIVRFDRFAAVIHHEEARLALFAAQRKPVCRKLRCIGCIGAAREYFHIGGALDARRVDRLGDSASAVDTDKAWTTRKA